MVVVTVVQFSSVHRRNSCEKTRLQYGSDLKRIKTQLSLKISENQVNIIGAKSCITLRTKREKDTGEEKKPTVQKLQPISEGKTSSSGDIPVGNWSIDLFEPPNVERGTTVRGARDSPTCIVKAVKSKNTFPRVLQNLKHRHPSQEDSSVSVYK